jgi:alpha-D-ribose 1-methylphosphonate 5-triphosphate synthase subunit PhnL
MTTFDHAKGEVLLEASIEGLSLSVRAGECVAVARPANAGGVSFAGRLYHSRLTRASGDFIRVRHDGEMIDLAQIDLRTRFAVSARTIALVHRSHSSLPRDSAITFVGDGAIASGWPHAEAMGQARSLLARLGLPETVWSHAFSELPEDMQRRVALARCLAGACPILVLDDPTKGLQPVHRDAVIGLLTERKAVGCALVGVFTDEVVRARIADRIIG